MARRRGEQHATNILNALLEADRPLGAYDLLDRLRPTGVAAPPTIYRALEQLIAVGKVHRIASINAFVACRDGALHHPRDGGAAPYRIVAFTICDRCGAADEFVDATLFRVLERGVGQRKFSPRASAIEIHGRCAACGVEAL